MAIAEKFAGTWTFVNSENFDAYLKEVGVGLLTRKMAVAMKPTLIFSVDGDKWKIVSESTFKTLSTFTLEGDKLIQIEKAIKSEDKDSRFERYIDENGQLIIVCSDTLMFPPFQN
ncbi:unnamed protein product [Gongylonema pulchrum]|uniref:FABP domain-containing protein n=1 Tax=Gongylonema pulchrum TaxID=637853 RepID=A0A183E6G0_9BILA|nr:unnamed protein product [Gongylonema pulchrum]